MGKRAAAVAVEGKVKEKLHAAAAEVFARKGYASATVREIVEKAGVTKPVLYYHFGNKEGVYKAILDAALGEFEERLAAVQRLKGNAALRLRRLCQEVYGIFRKHTDVIRVMHAIYYGPPQGAPFFDFDKALFRLDDSVLKLIRQGIRTGEFRGHAPSMVRAVLGVCNECIDIELAHPDMAVGPAGFDRILDVVFRGMKGKDGR
jgi:AcrR family transcriptional regulator